MTMAALVLGPLAVQLERVRSCSSRPSAVTLCAGHSVGMHRRLIHNSFECPLWLEYVMVYLGVLVGMAGPIGMIRSTTARLGAAPAGLPRLFLPPRGFWRDGWWQLHCELTGASRRHFRLEPRVTQRLFLPLDGADLDGAAASLGIAVLRDRRLPWLVWGVCARVAVCVTGHWLVGHFAHREGRPDLAGRGRVRAGP